MKRAYTYFGLICLLALLFAASGCSTSPEVPPQVQPPTNLGQGYVLLAEVRLTAADCVRQKILTPEEGRQVLQLTDNARLALDNARDAHFNGVEGAAEKGYQIADVILRSARQLIQARITARKEKVK